MNTWDVYVLRFLRVMAWVLQVIIFIHLLIISSRAEAIPAGTSPAGYIAQPYGTSRGFNIPPGLSCAGSSINVVYDCAEQIRQYTNANGYEVISMASTSIASWHGQILNLQNPERGPFEGSFGLRVDGYCPGGGKHKIDNATGERYCPGKYEEPKACMGNPISIYTGEKIQKEEDYSGNTLNPIIFNRIYHSNRESVVDAIALETGSIGKHWDHSYSAFLSGAVTSPMDYSWPLSELGSAETGTPTASFNDSIISHYMENPGQFALTVSLFRSNGSVLRFENHFDPNTQCYLSDTWEASNGDNYNELAVIDRCDTRSRFIFTDTSGVKEIYNSDGHLLRIEYSNGIQHLLEYIEDQLVSITHSLGDKLEF